MRPITDIRRDNLRRLIDDNDGPSAVAIRLGYVNSSFMAQLAGPNPIRNVTEKTARKYEEKLGLPPGWFDTEGAQRVRITDSGLEYIVAHHIDHTQQTSTPVNQGVSQPNSPVNADEQVDLLALVKLVGKLCEEKNVQMPVTKFADLVALALVDAQAHGGHAREEHLASVIQLLK